MPSKGDETRKRIVQRAAGTFNVQGYAGTSMSDLMQATGLEKGGIYNHFTNKEEIAIAAFDYAVSITDRRLREVYTEVKHSVERLLVYIEVFQELYDNPQLPGGCPVFNTAVESDDANPVLRAKSQAAMNDVLNMLQRITSKGIEQGEIKPNVNSLEVATIITSTLEGALVMSRLYRDDRYLKVAAEHLRQYIETSVRV
jgi:AcrR family transcriptional regulator